jgi:hypothetical protein
LIKSVALGEFRSKLEYDNSALSSSVEIGWYIYGSWRPNRSAPAADALEFLLEILVGVFHRLIGRAPSLNTLHIPDSRLPMTYRGLRNIALAFATTLRMRRRQNDLQIRPRAIWRDKKLSTNGTDDDQSQ